MEGLGQIGVSRNRRYPAREFWERHDPGESGKAPPRADPAVPAPAARVEPGGTDTIRRRGAREGVLGRLAVILAA
jgi:hypothetical protein